MGAPASTRAPVAAVTGGGQGIGRAIAAQLAGEGYRVAVLEREPAAREAVARALPASASLVIDADVSQESSVREAFARIEREWGGLEALVNNAAISNPYNAPVAELALADWERVLRVNLTGPLLCVKHAVPALRRSERGAIVQIASTRALQSEPNHEAYAASKGGLLALTHALAVSLGPSVRVNAVSPGWIDTRALKAAITPDRTPDPALRAEDHSQHPVGRVGRPEDIASLVSWLLSPQAGFVTGQNFVADGGMTRKMIYVE